MAPLTTPQRSLSRQFAGAAAALAAVAVLLIAAGSWWWIDRLHQQSARALAQRDVELRADQVRDTLVLIEERLRELAASPLLHTALTDSFGREAYLLPYLGSVQIINAIPVELVLVDFQGQELGRNGDVNLSAAEMGLLRQLLDERRTAAVLAPTPSGDDILFASMVLYPRTRTIEGALWARLPASRLRGEVGYRLLTGSAAREPVPSGSLRARIVLPPSLASLELAVQHDGPLNAGGEGRSASALVVGAAALALMAAVALVGHRLALRLTADLSALDQFAGRVAEGSFGAERAPETGATEVTGLAQSINRMLDQLNRQHAVQQDTAQKQLDLLGICIANLNDVVMITEGEPDPVHGHRIVFVNPAFTRLTGYPQDEVIGRSPKMLQGPMTDRAELDRIGASLRRWEPVRSEVVNYRKDGTRFWVEMDIVPVKDAKGWCTHWVSVERDTTARRDAAETRLVLEAQLREAQKIEALGTLAAGIAHDFNNILAAVLGSLGLARTELVQGRSIDARLDQIERSAGRARTLVEQILSYTRRQDSALQRMPQDLKALLTDSVSMLRATVPARVQMHTQVCEAPVHVTGDGVALEQVLINLGTNAWQAMGGTSGTITVGLEKLEIGPGGVVTAQAAPIATGSPPPALPTWPGRMTLLPGTYAHVWVADDGRGMDADTQARVFEPFFTTKAPGEGTGLGLSVVQGIVRAHGGAIGVASAPDAGCVFHVLLPECAAAPVPVAAGRAAPTPRGQGQHVLYIDDDEVMVNVAAGLLEHWGYRVTTLGTAVEALAAVRAEPNRYDLVITDYNMPGLSGLDLLRALRPLRTDLPVVLTSGYIADELRAEAQAAGAFFLMRKENLHDELAALVARALVA